MDPATATAVLSRMSATLDDQMSMDLENPATGNDV
jgi:hypothetical protein